LKNKGKQQRSRETIKTILGAAAQVLIEQGYEKATTNRIAECAGYSVGTLYQYFDHKEDIYG
jgi:AcrR family transcriptional regulator